MDPVVLSEPRASMKERRASTKGRQDKFEWRSFSQNVMEIRSRPQVLTLGGICGGTHDNVVFAVAISQANLFRRYTFGPKPRLGIRAMALDAIPSWKSFV